MPHARKPKKRKSDNNTPSIDTTVTKKVKRDTVKKELKEKSEEKLPQQEEGRGTEENNSNDKFAWKQKVLQTIFVAGQKIQVQTKIPRLSKDCNRPSVFLRLDSKNFSSHFAECWEEHIDGFIGLRGSKRERTEKEKNMEWRTRVKALPNIKKHTEVRKSGQSVSEQERLLVIQRYREMKKKKDES